MKLIITKKKQGAFIIGGFIMVACFSSAFGNYQHIVSNKTPHTVIATIKYGKCGDDSMLTIPPEDARSAPNLCLVKEVSATVFVNWNSTPASPGIIGWADNVKNKARGAIIARPYVFNDSPLKAAEKGAAIGASAGAVVGFGVTVEEGPVGFIPGTIGGAGAGATYGAIGGAIKGTGLGGDHIWYVNGSNEEGYHVDLIK